MPKNLGRGRIVSYEYNAECDVCGWKYPASELLQRWDGYMVCKGDWEPRNILDFYEPRSDAHLLPFTRPPQEVFITLPLTGYGCAGLRTQGLADIGTAGCARADKGTY